MKLHPSVVSLCVRKSVPTHEEIMATTVYFVFWMIKKGTVSCLFSLFKEKSVFLNIQLVNV